MLSCRFLIISNCGLMTGRAGNAPNGLNTWFIYNSFSSIGRASQALEIASFNCCFGVPGCIHWYRVRVRLENSDLAAFRTCSGFCCVSLQHEWHSVRTIAFLSNLCSKNSSKTWLSRFGVVKSIVSLESNELPWNINNLIRNNIRIVHLLVCLTYFPFPLRKFGLFLFIFDVSMILNSYRHEWYATSNTPRVANIIKQNSLPPAVKELSVFVSISIKSYEFRFAYILSLKSRKSSQSKWESIEERPFHRLHIVFSTKTSTLYALEAIKNVQVCVSGTARKCRLFAYEKSVYVIKERYSSTCRLVLGHCIANKSLALCLKWRRRK